MSLPRQGSYGRKASPAALIPFLPLIILSLGFLFCAPLSCPAQTSAPHCALEDGYYSSPIPLSYQDEGLKKGAEKEPLLRRSLIIAAGSFPFSYFYTNLAFDFVRYAVNGFDSLYAPWPFRSVGSVSIDTEETFMRLGVGVGLSLAIGIADILIR